MHSSASLGKQLVLIVGAPRSGTTWLHRMLDAHECITRSDEMELFDSYTLPLTTTWDAHAQLNDMVQNKTKHGLTAAFTEQQFYEFLRQLVVQTYAPYIERKPGVRVIVDKTPRYALCVEHIYKLVPDVKIIHLVRDGRDVAASMLHASQSWAEWWAPKDIESGATVWSEYVQGARKGEKLKGQFIEVRYEDLLTNGEQVLTNLFAFIGVRADQRNVSDIVAHHQFEKMKERSKTDSRLWQPEGFYRKGKAGDWQMSLTPMQRYLFHMVAGDLLCELGYAEPAWWAEHAHQRLTLPLLSLFPKTGYRRLVKLKHAVKHIVGMSLWGRLRGSQGSEQSRDDAPPVTRVTGD